jgi:hypothetical protein
MFRENYDHGKALFLCHFIPSDLQGQYLKVPRLFATAAASGVPVEESDMVVLSSQGTIKDQAGCAPRFGRTGGGLDTPARLLHERTAGMERAARGRIDRIGYLTFDAFASATRQGQIRYRIKQHPRVGVLW